MALQDIIYYFNKPFKPISPKLTKMMFKTHLAFGFLVGLLGIKYLNPGNQILFMLLCMFGAALPDIDHPRSKIGRKVKVVAMLFEHRGFWHSLFVLVPLSFVLLYFVSRINAYAVLLGYVSHLAIDCLTYEGIMPLHPLSRFRIKGIMKTGAEAEFVILILLVIADAYMLINF